MRVWFSGLPDEGGTNFDNMEATNGWSVVTKSSPIQPSAKPRIEPSMA